ncbi:MAG: TadE/TadG family type IV pilus assembly protein [Dehalococcoidia bacterium]
MRTNGRTSDGRRRDTAQASVEFVMMFPFVLLLILGLVEFGWLMFTTLTVNNAAHEAARYAAVGNVVGDCDGGVIERAVLVGSGIVDCSDVTVTFIDPDSDGVFRGDSVIVRINHPYVSITPLVAIASSFSLGTISTDINIAACSDARLQSPTQEPSPDTSGTSCTS